VSNDGGAVYAIASPETLVRWDTKNDEFMKSTSTPWRYTIRLSEAPGPLEENATGIPFTAVHLLTSDRSIITLCPIEDREVIHVTKMGERKKLTCRRACLTC
jgi:hypothetical protein